MKKNELMTAGAAAALSVVAALYTALLVASPAEATTCKVTVIITHQDGKEDTTVAHTQRSCRVGETNGGVEYYNPFSNTYSFNPDPTPPLTDTKGNVVPGTGSGPGNFIVSRTPQTSNCAPTANGGKAQKKTKTATTTKPGCPATSTNNKNTQ